jgi:transposase
MLGGMDDAPAIPDDLAACQAMIREQARTIAEQSQAIASQSQAIASQTHKIEARDHTIESHTLTIGELERQTQSLKKDFQELQLAFNELIQRTFRNRSERYLANPNQLKLDFQGAPEAADAAAGLAEAVEEAEIVIPEHKRRVQKPKRSEKLPEHLPRYEVEAPVPDAVKHCPEHGERKVIGYDTTETLEFERPKLRVRVTRYPKYACPNQPECGVASPERARGLVEGNRYDTSVAAEVITGKYAYHLPIYREQDYFAGCGWTPARSTLLNLLEASARVIRPLIAYFRQTLIADGLLGTDDTRTTLLLPQDGNIPPPIPGDLKSERIHEVFQEAFQENKPSVSGRMWVYRGVTVPLNVFDFTVSRHRDGPELFLKDFRGTLLGDCYSGYQGIVLRSEGAIRRAACCAHARRKVLDAQAVYPREASLLLGMFQHLYDMEDRGKTMSVDERQALREREAAPIWNSMGEWLEGDTAKAVLPKSGLAEALGYLRNHWGPLREYLSDGRLPIDNNEAEQLMKQVAIGRKNWLFVGSVAAGERAADFFSLVSGAVRNDLDVWAYLKDVLDRLLAGSTDYESLRPDRWRETHPECIRQYRVAERRDRADRKQRRRAARRPGSR